MAIMASLSGANLFSSPPSPPLKNDAIKRPSNPPIPIPKYPPKKRQVREKSPSEKAFRAPHRGTNYYKPVSDGVISAEEDGRSVVIGESGVSYLIPGAPFEFQFSYSETPKGKPLAIREPAHFPFAPPTMGRPWTGKAPLKKKKEKRKIKLFDSFDSLIAEEKNGEKKMMHMLRPFEIGESMREKRSREEILGSPVKRGEVRALVKPCLSNNRQVNLGRDGLTHNMLELIHSHWRRQAVCKVRCKGVPTVDMDNVCHHLEERTRGKIILRMGGVVYLFRGRNYDHRTRPRYPIMLWKPATPVYPKLIQEAPEGLTKSEADELRKKGKNLLPICKLAKNGVYITLVKDVRDAFEASSIVKINCQGMHASDYKKIGAKLKELVPCILLSFDDEQILMWRGQDWKSMYQDTPPTVSGDNSTHYSNLNNTSLLSSDDTTGAENLVSDQMVGLDVGASSPKIKSKRMMSLWKNAIESRKALFLEEINLDPDALLKKVEEFQNVSQAMEHSYPAVVLPEAEAGKISEDSSGKSWEFEDDDDDDSGEDFEVIDESVPLGSLPVDFLAEQLSSD
ncbi:hypothetical protein AMTRI_Chr02g266500 [Amborella trichopoda]